MTGPSMAIGGRTMFTLEPSDSLVSVIGTDSLTILLDIAAIFCTISSSLHLLIKNLSHFNNLPSFS